MDIDEFIKKGLVEKTYLEIFIPFKISRMLEIFLDGIEREEKYDESRLRVKSFLFRFPKEIGMEEIKKRIKSIIETNKETYELITNKNSGKIEGMRIYYIDKFFTPDMIEWNKKK